MTAACLLGVFLVARAAVLAGRELPGSPWSPLAYLGQDAAAALLFALFDAVTRRRRWIGWTAYALAVAYVAVNVPVARVVGAPLTWTMLRAARPELSDSIRHYASSQNVALVVLVAGVGAALPIVARRARWTPGDMRLRGGHRSAPGARHPLPIRRRISGHAALLALFALAGAGSFAARHVDTAGLERNALLALVTTALPRVVAHHASDEWRVSPFDDGRRGEPLTRYRGAASGRNVILVVLESAGARYLRPYGAALDPTPNLTELARRALVFDAYAVYPESVKGLFSLLCSQYSAFDTEPEQYRGIPVPSVAQLLSRAGYRTALFHSGRFMYLGMDAIIGDRGFGTLEDAGAIGGQHESSFGIDEASTVRRMLAWIDAQPREAASTETGPHEAASRETGPHKRPFFLTYLPIAGHHPYATAEPGPFSGEREIDRYHNALHEADRALGALRAGLRERGLDDRSVFVVLGDHGEAFGQHAGNYGHTLHIYEENVRVPLLIAAPGVVLEAVRVASPASLIDVAPTALDLLGIPAPSEYQGQSLLDGAPAMALFYTDYSQGLLGLRDGCSKYIYDLDARRSKLFDVCRDPDERQDLSDALPERVESYRERVRRWSAAQRARILAATSPGR